MHLLCFPIPLALDALPKSAEPQDPRKYGKKSAESGAGEERVGNVSGVHGRWCAQIFLPRGRETIRRCPICCTKPIAVVVRDGTEKKEKRENGTSCTTVARRYPIFVTENRSRYRIK